MAIEIERKFLVDGDGYKSGKAVRILQGYICSTPDRVVRVRVKGEKAYLTIKSASVGFARYEFEYQIPVDDAMKMLHEICEQPVIDKTRYICDYKGSVWEIDEFHADNDGLVMAEIELEHEDDEFSKPDFIAQEVTGDERYYNACLFKNPYKYWSK